MYYKIIRFEREWHKLGITGLYLFKLDLEEYLQAGGCYYTKNALINLQFFIDENQQPKPSDLCEYFWNRRLNELRYRIYYEWRILKNLKSKPSKQLKITNNL